MYIIFVKLVDRFIPSEFRKSPETEFRAKLLVSLTAAVGIALWMGLLLLVVMVPESRTSLRTLLIIDFFFGLLCFLGLWIFYKTKSFIWGSLPAISLVIGTVLTAGFQNGGIRAPIVPIVFLLPLLSQFFTGDRQFGRFGLGLSLILLIGLLVLGLTGVAQPLAFVDISLHSKVLFIVYATVCILSFGIALAYEHSRKKTEARVTQFAKISSLDFISKGFAHEVNSSLTAIILSSSQLLQKSTTETLDPENLKKSILRIQKSTAKISAVVKAIMSSQADVQNSPITESSAKAIIENTLFLCEENLRQKGIDVSVEGEIDSISLRCCPTLLSQVLFSLVQNSMDALQEVSDKWLKLKVQVRGEVVEFSVSDSGKPLSKEVREKLFVPFFSTKDVGQGFGLGLATCASVISLQGGQIEFVDSAPNTTFLIRLPKVLKMEPPPFA